MPLQKNYAFAFILYDSDLIKKLAVSAQSLTLTGTNHDIILLVGGTCNSSRITEADWSIIGSHFSSQRLVTDIPNPTNCASYQKVHLWSLTEYSKVIYLDFDVLVLQNLDHLFLQDTGDFAAVPDVGMPEYFNAGFLVLVPSLSVFKRMTSSVMTTPSYDDGDQGFFNVFFEYWVAYDARQRLPFRYNAIIHFKNDSSRTPKGFDVNCAADWLGPLSVIHFAGGYFQPWKTIPKQCTIWCRLWLLLHKKMEQNGWERLASDWRTFLSQISQQERQILLRNDNSLTSGSRKANHKLNVNLLKWLELNNSFARRGYFDFGSLFSGQCFVSEMGQWNKRNLTAPKGHKYLHPKRGHKFNDDAFVTLLSREQDAFYLGMWSQSYVRAHGLANTNKTSVVRPTVLAVLSTIPKKVWTPFAKSFSRVITVDPVTVRVSEGQTLALGPEFSVLHLWKEVKYKQLIFVHSFSYFWDDCNGILDSEPFAAAPLAFPGDRFNWRTLLLRPDKGIHRDFFLKLRNPSYPRDSIQDFLNAYFNGWFSYPMNHRLPFKYATDITLKTNSLKFVYFWKIISFDPDYPPLHYNVSQLKSQRRGIAFKRWRKMFCGKSMSKFRPLEFEYYCM